MKINIATLFPQMCESVLAASIIGRAIRSGVVVVQVHDIRDYAEGRYKQVDDCLYGGGFGMLLQAEPVYRCIRAIKESLCAGKPWVIYMSPKGTRLTQRRVAELAEKDDIVIFAGHYEGVDQRVLDLVVDEEISIGDYVLTGGELPALVLIDAVLRWVPGVLPHEESYLNESHSNGGLEHAQYTRPEVWRGFRVPAALLSGDEKKIRAWKEESAFKLTQAKRPDLLD
ncbi:MAG: tRNA (guanosine(37)-N1)-methyltransferase TrmD [Oscillospiraceae bacterium]|jgi:tRNA (guanine37-N1)-methyltransferase|nr:tRNA (guanosine(37)-N1)-methyltransferase TrmD [Oscillospiraceae bacterium]